MAAKETVRPVPHSAAIEDYCKAIYTLEARYSGAVSTNALADRLGLTTGSVSGMLRKLDESGLITHVPYRGVRLTDRGRRVALEVIRHHRLLELFLAETLEMPWDRVHDEAEVLEHVLSEELELQEPATRSLDTLHLDDEGTFVRISDSDPEMLRYLSERGIRPGGRVRVLDRQPFGGPLTVSVDGNEHTLGGELVQAMRIEVSV